MTTSVIETPAETIQGVNRRLRLIADDGYAISAYATMLAVLLAGQDAECALEGVHKLLHVINAHATETIENAERGRNALSRFDLAEHFTRECTQ